MKTPKLIKQKHDKGCVPACLAMITGETYDYVASKFLVDFDKTGVKYDTIIIDFIISHGFMVERRKVYGCEHIKVNNKLLSKPFADIHFVVVKQFIDKTNEHAIVMLKNGKLLCPSGTNCKFTDFYEIIEVFGCYKT